MDVHRVGLVVLLVILAACGNPHRGPAAEALTVEEVVDVECESPQRHLRCLNVTVRNLGTDVADGSCELKAVGRDNLYLKTFVPKTIAEVTDVQPGGETVERVEVQLSKPAARAVVQWSSSCDPGIEG